MGVRYDPGGMIGEIKTTTTTTTVLKEKNVITATESPGTVWVLFISHLIIFLKCQNKGTFTLER